MHACSPPAHGWIFYQYAAVQHFRQSMQFETVFIWVLVWFNINPNHITLMHHQLSPHFHLNQLQTRFLAQQACMHAWPMQANKKGFLSVVPVVWVFFFFYFFSFLFFLSVDNVLLAINALPSPLVAHPFPPPRQFQPEGAEAGAKGPPGIQNLPSTKDKHK